MVRAASGSKEVVFCCHAPPSWLLSSFVANAWMDIVSCRAQCTLSPSCTRRTTTACLAPCTSTSCVSVTERSVASASRLYASDGYVPAVIVGLLDAPCACSQNNELSLGRAAKSICSCQILAHTTCAQCCCCCSNWIAVFLLYTFYLNDVGVADGEEGGCPRCPQGMSMLFVKCEQ
jgi:hypothetical protein